MARRWIVRPLAQGDIDDAVTWYEQQQSGLGSRFLDALDHVFKRVRDAPLQFPAISVLAMRLAPHVSVRRVLQGNRTSGRDLGRPASAPRSSDLATSRVKVGECCRAEIETC
jgi:hypothetical protein